MVIGAGLVKNSAMNVRSVAGSIRCTYHHSIADPGCATVAIAQSKALLNENVDRTLRDALASEARAQAINFATADVPSAFAAFSDRTEPRFTGEWMVT